MTYAMVLGAMFRTGPVHAQFDLLYAFPFVGSGGSQLANAVVSDAMGNTYTCGLFYCAFGSPMDMDPGPGVSPLTSPGGQDIFFAKYSPAGALLWAHRIGSSWDDLPFALALDGSGDLLLVGRIGGPTDLDPSASTHVVSGESEGNAFLAKYDADGNFIWGFSIGGSGHDIACGLAADQATGNIVIGGFTNSFAMDLDPGVGSTNVSNPSGTEAPFLAAYDGNGTFQWGFGASSSSGAEFTSIAADGQGNLYAGGFTLGTDGVDFDPGPGTALLASANSSADILVCKYSSSGAYLWGHVMGGVSAEIASSVIVDQAAANIYFTGYYGSPTIDLDPGSGTHIVASAGGTDMYVEKMSAAGEFVWAVNVGGTGWETANSLALDAAGNVFVCGGFSNTADFDPGPAVNELTSIGEEDIFIADYDPSGSYMAAMGAGGVNNYDEARALAFSSDGHLHVCGLGSGDSLLMDPVAGTYMLVPGAGLNYYGFLAAYDPSGTTGMAGPMPDDEVRPWPNPAGSVVSVGWHGARPISVDAVDASGRATPLKATPVGAQLKIPVSELRPGLYTLRIRTDARLAIARVVVE